ncbi:GH1 family beta-glucosidase [Spirochaeta cellobiosiphila]|uniref:GH1 family beta-glucosidase n=1 Tax=Spirochaeta cellobiosiphila TaxID=504483 RepID=UPI000418ECED|nr:GH1 family beta-glucosidase [Spirochaeta cellobiosiphila]
MNNDFPHDFVFGVATSAYQIEGAVGEGGRTPSIWDTFSHTPGKTELNHNGDIACDHYHLYKDDVQLIKNLGVGAYRFSTSWNRVFPKGYGEVNQEGMDFYKKLVDELLENNIEPFLTLYHWDLPQCLYDEGGWMNRDTLKAFEEYAGTMVHVLGDKVKNWMTHNEMWCTAMLGHHQGIFAPGESNFKNALQVAHGVLVSHGMAIRAMRSTGQDLNLGIAPNFLPSYPQDPDKERDRKAAANFDGYFNRWFLDPLVGRGYPEDMLNLYGPLCPKVESGDMEIIASDIDFLGVNYYNSNWYTWSEEDKLLHTASVDQPHLEWTADRDIYPEGLYDTLERLYKDYGFKSLYVTENGAAYDDHIDSLDSNRVHDPGRVKFLQDHFDQALRAVKDNIPLNGYFVWSLMDNFEWAAGYTIRYGLHYVDYDTQQRIPKDSALWYKDFIDSGK